MKPNLPVCNKKLSKELNHNMKHVVKAVVLSSAVTNRYGEAMRVLIFKLLVEDMGDTYVTQSYHVTWSPGHLVTWSLGHCRQHSSVPQTLRNFIHLLLNGKDYCQDPDEENQASLSISQLILYNCKKRQSRSWKTLEQRHSKKREPLLPIYIGLNIYSHTIKAQLFTVAAYDNLNHNPMSRIISWNWNILISIRRESRFRGTQLFHYYHLEAKRKLLPSKFRNTTNNNER